MQKKRYALAGICSFLILYLLAPLPAIASSGIRINPPNTVRAVGDSSPPPTVLDFEKTYYFQIENTNDVCDEEVKIDKGIFLNDPDHLLAKRGRSEFVGFSLDSNGPFQPSLRFVLEDETCEGCARPPYTIYFRVKTGEDSNGCDFRGWKLPIIVCDQGEHCFTCCDNYDGDIPCEGPTKVTPSIVYEEGPGLAFLPTGTGTISGRVTGPHPLIQTLIVGKDASILVTPIRNCVPGQRDEEKQLVLKKGKTDPAVLNAKKGFYTIANLDYGQYLVTARITLLKAKTQTITLSQTNPTIIIDFIFP